MYLAYTEILIIKYDYFRYWIIIIFSTRSFKFFKQEEVKFLELIIKINQKISKK